MSHGLQSTIDHFLIPATYLFSFGSISLLYKLHCYTLAFINVTMAEDGSSDFRISILSEPASQRSKAILGSSLESLIPLGYTTGAKTSPRARTSAPLPIFPAEIWIHILTLADVKTLMTLRNVNATARNFINSLTEYRDVADTYPNLLRVTVYTGVASWLSILNLRRALYSKKCDVCTTRNGEYVYLLNSSRVCRECLTQSGQTRVIPLGKARERYTLTEQDLVHFPQVLTIPGAYGPEDATLKTRLTLMNRRELHEIAQKHSLKPPHPILPKWGLLDKCLPFMCAIRAPWVEKDSKSIHWGFTCKPCVYDGQYIDDDPRIFDRVEFLSHVESCNNARMAWLGD